jgi:hypothetical protein
VSGNAASAAIASKAAASTIFAFREAFVGIDILKLLVLLRIGETFHLNMPEAGNVQVFERFLTFANRLEAV